jgi:anthranilate phosphoribosyltransferase
MKYVQPIRKSLGFRTVFNILGPLANPAGVPSLVLGVAEERLMPMMAEALNILGTRYAMVVHSDGLDEISTAAPTRVAELKEGRITNKELNPQDLGIASADIEGLKVADAATSAKVLMDILRGEQAGAGRDIVALNASAAIIAGGLAQEFDAAMKLAQASISEGRALECLEKLVEVSNKA